MSLTTNNWIVDTDWLQERLNAPDLVIFDATWHMPGAQRNAHDEYLQEHIPGALFFDIDELSDTQSDLPHMLPPPAKFAARMKAMGVGDGQSIVIYDTHGVFSAPRAWWTFRAMGHAEVAVLNGGLKKWKAEGRPLEDGPPATRTGRHFTPRHDASLVRDLADVRTIIDSNSAQIVDARPPARFTGEEPEPRPGLRQGHIPGSRNVCFKAVLNDDGTMKSANEIREAFSQSGVDLNTPIVTTCGSGVTASILTLALAVTGITTSAVYDGSWTEWGAPDGPKLATGPAAN